MDVDIVRNTRLAGRLYSEDRTLVNSAKMAWELEAFCDNPNYLSADVKPLQHTLYPQVR